MVRGGHTGNNYILLYIQCNLNHVAVNQFHETSRGGPLKVTHLSVELYVFVLLLTNDNRVLWRYRVGYVQYMYMYMYTVIYDRPTCISHKES